MILGAMGAGAGSDYAELEVVGGHSQGFWRKAGAPGRSESRLFWRSLTGVGSVSRTQAVLVQTH